MQLGSFYPFARNHNSVGWRSQEPYQFSKKMTDISRNALMNRYALLPYYYTLFYKVHVNVCLKAIDDNKFFREVQ